MTGRGTYLGIEHDDDVNSSISNGGSYVRVCCTDEDYDGVKVIQARQKFHQLSTWLQNHSNQRYRDPS